MRDSKNFHMKEARFYKAEKNNSVKCFLCGHNCLINENQPGICNVRVNKGGKLYSFNYGYPVMQNIDPVEKIPLFHFMPGSLTYSLGNFGCNFKCDNCQNYSISQMENINERVEKADFVMPERIIEEAIGNDCQSVAYLKSEPTVNCEYALDIMRLAHANGLKNIWVSNGFMSKDCLSAILPYLDAVNVDLKSMDTDFYQHNCSAKLKPVLENLKILKQEQVHLEISTHIIPTLSDDSDMLCELAEFIAVELDADTPWHLAKFYPDLSWKLKNLPITGEDSIYQAYEIGKDAGLKYVYVGNIPGDQKENTYCPKCDELAIRRLGYNIERFDNNGRCVYCDRSLDIIE